MEKLFNPKIREQAIDTTCSNFIMAGILEAKDIVPFLKQAGKWSDTELAEMLCESRLMLDNYFERRVSQCQN